MKITKQDKAITLIALVITIIVLLILAGITVAELSNNGLFVRTQIAKEKYDNSMDIENGILDDYEKEISKNTRETVTISKEDYDKLMRKGYTLLWEGVANKVGSADNSGNDYKFKEATMDVTNYDFILMEFHQNSNPLYDVALESNLVSSASIKKNEAHNIRFTSYDTRYTGLHFIDNGFVIDGINAESAVGAAGYQYLTKVYGLNL